MSKLTKIIRQVAGNKYIFIVIVLLLIVGVLMENLPFLYIVTLIFVLLMIIDTVNWESIKERMKWEQ